MITSRKTPFHIQLSYLFASLIIVFGISLGVLQFEKMSQILLVEVSSQYELIGQKVISSTLAVYERAKVQTQLLAHHDLVQAATLEQRLHFVPYLASAIDSSDATVAAYVAYSDGQLFSLRAWTETNLMRQRFNPPEQTYWLVESLAKTNTGWTETVIFLDDHCRELQRQVRNDLAYDVRERPWYKVAMQHPADEVVGGRPPLFPYRWHARIQLRHTHC